SRRRTATDGKITSMLNAIRTLGVFVCLPASVWTQQESKPQTDVQRAIDEFKIQTATLGLRGERTVKQTQNLDMLRQWHGRLYENFRNDGLDAVPHEIVQRGGRKSVLRRNQFGFNVAGPFFFPRLTHGKNGTFVSLSFEGVRENISR